MKYYIFNTTRNIIQIRDRLKIKNEEEKYRTEIEEKTIQNS